MLRKSTPTECISSEENALKWVIARVFPVRAVTESVPKLRLTSSLEKAVKSWMIAVRHPIIWCSLPIAFETDRAAQIGSIAIRSDVNRP